MAAASSFHRSLVPPMTTIASKGAWSLSELPPLLLLLSTCVSLAGMAATLSRGLPSTVTESEGPSSAWRRSPGGENSLNRLATWPAVRESPKRRTRGGDP